MVVVVCLLEFVVYSFCYFFSSRRRHTRCLSDWSSDVCSSDLLRIAPDPGQQFRIGELIVFQAGVDVRLAVAREQSSEAEALDESLDLARRQRLLPQIHHVDGHAALFENPLGGARRRRVLQAENLHAHHPLPQHNDISSLYIQHFTWSSPFHHASPARK